MTERRLSARSQAALDRLKAARDQDLKAVLDNHATLRGQRDNLRNDLSGQVNNLAEAREMIDRLRAQLTSTKDNLTTCQGDLNRVTSDLQQVRADWTEVAAERDAALEECEIMATAIEETATHIAQIKQATEEEVAEPSQTSTTQGS